MDKRSVVLVTGGTRGIGLAVAEAFARRGDVVAVSGGHDPEALAQAVERLTGIQPDATGELVDVRDRRRVTEWVSRIVARWGRIDVAIANAGILRPRPFLEIAEEQWDDVVDTHLKGTFLVLQAVARTMVERQIGGSLITVIAPTALRGSTGVADYASAKGGIAALTRNLATELAPWGIRVNSVLPVAETRMTEALQEYGQVYGGNRADRYRRGTRPQPADIVGPFLFLASPQAQLVTGQVLAVGQSP